MNTENVPTRSENAMQNDNYGLLRNLMLKSNTYLFFYYLRRFPRVILKHFFRFNAWHLKGLRDKAYAQAIIQYLNSCPEENRVGVVEIGCGLGDILRNIRFKQRVGLDFENEVLAAAKFLPSSKRKGDIVDFKYFKFPDSTLVGRYNYIIMVNWIHRIPPEQLKKSISAFFDNNLTEGGIIVDTKRNDSFSNENQRFEHEIEYLNVSEKPPLHLGQFENGKVDIWMIQK